MSVADAESCKIGRQIILQQAGLIKNRPLHKIIRLELRIVCDEARQICLTFWWTSCFGRKRNRVPESVPAKSPDTRLYKCGTPILFWICYKPSLKCCNQYWATQ